MSKGQLRVEYSIYCDKEISNPPTNIVCFIFKKNSSISKYDLTMTHYYSILNQLFSYERPGTTGLAVFPKFNSMKIIMTISARNVFEKLADLCYL